MAEERETTDLGQRAHVTLMFADLCDYTALSELIDPEELDAIRSQLDTLASSIVWKHGGHVTQAYGDGQLCLFGYPQPREDDVRRTLDAALELHAAVRAASWPNLPAGFEARLHTGVHSGLVFVRKGTQVHGRYQLSGDAVNTASRLSGVAQRDEIFVSAATLRGSEQFFEVTPVPALWLRGKSQPQEAFRVSGRSDVRTRFEASTRRGLTLFVNRHHELGALLENQRAANAGRGRLLLVRGAAGIGKTRLLEEFSARAQGLGVRVLRGTCENYGELVPLEPFTQILRQVFGDVAGKSEAEAGATIERQCQQLGNLVAAQRSTYLILMALQSARGRELGSANLVQALSALIEALALRQPLTLILDDWQWADGASRAVLAQLREVALARGACLVIGMRAPERVDPTLQPDALLHLPPLTQPDCARFIAALQPDPLSMDVSEIVLQRAGGNPLFMEELCRALPHMSLGKRGPFDHWEVPTTVQGVIQTRIAGLPPADRDLLRLAAVIGIEFNTAMLAELCDAAPHDVRARLKSLIAEDLIYTGEAPETYHFKHGLTREVVYESVLIAERKQLHGRVATWIERSAAAAEDSMHTAEALAYHYRGCGDLVRAAQHAELAGDRALAVSALDRACHHYYAALHALDAMPASPELRRRWLAVSAKWGLPFVFSPVQTELGVLHTAVKYATELGDLEAKARSLHWLGWAHYSLGNYAESIQHYRETLDLAQELGDVRLVLQAKAGLGQSQAAAGNYEAGLQNLNSAIAGKRELAQGRVSRSGRLAQGYAFALASTGLVHADRGDFALADEVFVEALSAVAGIHHAIEGSVLALKCIALLWRGHWEEARETAGRAQQNAQRVNSAFNFVTCSCYGAYAAWESTRAFEHIERMRATIDWIEAQHLELYAGADYGWCAHALQSYGDPELARTYVDRALKRAAVGDPMGEAMAYRVLAQLEPEASDRWHVDLCLERALRAGEARGSRHEALKTDLLRAQLCSKRGELADARRWAEACLTAARELGMPWHLARAEQLRSNTR